VTPRVWTCRRRSGGVACGHVNPARKRNCEACGLPRPARRRPKHLAALDIDYAAFIKLNGGEHCAICGRGPTAARRLDRDHDHRTGEPRGLLCHSCNRFLPHFSTPDWLRAAADYLERFGGPKTQA
jgi:ribosomal protein L37E